ncbi:fibrillarin-like rRNA/tRNA 2'-O-methyltransferase [Candidatus Bathyarchaeota archaeon]|nr:fibrillarin-like rRNA/tRNA 2'-O-methyltransferase [Candidatus Bathyarchaeota archaeon]
MSEPIPLNATLEELFPGIYNLHTDDGAYLATRNLTPGRTYYGEPTYEVDGVEYRSWNPTRSKLAAAIMKGIKYMPVKPGCRVLYLGVASGTTVSHVSDVIGVEGHVWGLDFAPRSLRDLLDNVTKYRVNISPILGDARKPGEYSMLVPKVDVVFADVAQPDQAGIVVKNAKMFLRKGGWAMLSIKSRSVNVTQKPKDVFSDQAAVLEAGGLKVHELVELDPYEKDHAMALAESA